MKMLGAILGVKIGTRLWMSSKLERMNRFNNDTTVNFKWDNVHKI